MLLVDLIQVPTQSRPTVPSVLALWLHGRSEICDNRQLHTSKFAKSTICVLLNCTNCGFVLEFLQSFRRTYGSKTRRELAHWQWSEIGTHVVVLLYRSSNFLSWHMQLVVSCATKFLIGICSSSPALYANDSIPSMILPYYQRCFFTLHITQLYLKSNFVNFDQVQTFS